MPEHDEPITTVPRLVAPDDRLFIAVAYQAVLGRAPDPEGGAHYLAQLRAGAHKLAILKQLRRSAEGRAFIPGVAGLDRAIKRYHWATRPVLGAIVRLFTGEEGNGATHRRLRMLANDISRLLIEQSAQRDAIRHLVGQTGKDWGGLAPYVASGQTEDIFQNKVPLPPALHPDQETIPASLDSKEREVLGTLRRSAFLKGARA
jgi:hypothetical protein